MECSTPPSKEMECSTPTSKEMECSTPTSKEMECSNSHMGKRMECSMFYSHGGFYFYSQMAHSWFPLPYVTHFNMLLPNDYLRKKVDCTRHKLFKTSNFFSQKSINNRILILRVTHLQR